MEPGPFVSSLFKINSWIYTIALFVLICAAAMAWRRTKHWSFLAFIAGLLLPLVYTVLMGIYSMITLQGLADEALREAQIGLWQTKMVGSQVVGIVEWLILLVAGLGLIMKMKKSGLAPVEPAADRSRRAGR